MTNGVGLSSILDFLRAFSRAKRALSSSSSPSTIVLAYMIYIYAMSEVGYC